MTDITISLVGLFFVLLVGVGICNRNLRVMQRKMAYLQERMEVQERIQQQVTRQVAFHIVNGAVLTQEVSGLAVVESKPKQINYETNPPKPGAWIE